MSRLEHPESKIFVGALSRTVTTRDLLAHFEKFGAVRNAHVNVNYETKQPGGFGFVEFVDPAVVAHVLSQNHILGSRVADVKIYRPPSSCKPGVPNFTDRPRSSEVDLGTNRLSNAVELETRAIPPVSFAGISCLDSDEEFPLRKKEAGSTKSAGDPPTSGSSVYFDAVETVEPNKTVTSPRQFFSRLSPIRSTNGAAENESVPEQTSVDHAQLIPKSPYWGEESDRSVPDSYFLHRELPPTAAEHPGISQNGEGDRLIGQPLGSLSRPRFGHAAIRTVTMNIDSQRQVDGVVNRSVFVEATLSENASHPRGNGVPDRNCVETSRSGQNSRSSTLSRTTSWRDREAEPKREVDITDFFARRMKDHCSSKVVTEERAGSPRQNSDDRDAAVPLPNNGYTLEVLEKRAARAAARSFASVAKPAKFVSLIGNPLSSIPVPQNYSIGDIIQVYASWVNSPRDMFVVHDESAQFTAALEQLGHIMNRQCPQRPKLFALPAVGSAVAAQFSKDMNWYRAVVASVGPNDQVEVLFFDYGNSEVTRLESLRRIDEDWMKVTRMTLHIVIDVLPLDGDEFSDDQIKACRKLLVNKSAEFRIYEIRNDVLVGMLYVEDEVAKVGMRKAVLDLYAAHKIAQPPPRNPLVNGHPVASFGALNETGKLGEIPAVQNAASSRPLTASSSSPMPTASSSDSNNPRSNDTAHPVEPTRFATSSAREVAVVSVGHRPRSARDKLAKVIVGHVVDAFTMWLTLDDGGKNATRTRLLVNEELAECRLLPFAEMPTVGKLICVKLTAPRNRAIYRAGVIRVNDNLNATVVLIDEGITQNVNLSQMFLLPERILKIPQSAFLASVRQPNDPDRVPLLRRPLVGLRGIFTYERMSNGIQVGELLLEQKEDGANFDVRRRVLQQARALESLSYD